MTVPGSPGSPRLRPGRPQDLVTLSPLALIACEVQVFDVEGVVAAWGVCGMVVREGVFPTARLGTRNHSNRLWWGKSPQPWK